MVSPKFVSTGLLILICSSLGCAVLLASMDEHKPNEPTKATAGSGRGSGGVVSSAIGSVGGYGAGRGGGGGVGGGGGYGSGRGSSTGGAGGGYARCRLGMGVGGSGGSGG
ncbi:hypothetical protein NMG60_11003453 [Bertholletia excelsa]